MEKHLKAKQEYIDRYDRHTVERCRKAEKRWSEQKELPPLEGKKLSEEQATAIKKMGTELYLHFETGERYLKKEETIKEWMDADQKKDDLLESAQAPEGIRCLTCRKLVTPTYKQLWTELGKEDRVLFMYDCANNCVPRRSFFSDGQEWRSKANLCPRCSTALDHDSKDDGKKLVTTDTCPKCGYTKTDEIEWTYKKEEEVDEDFAKDRDRFCLTDEEGQKYQSEKWNLERMGKFMEEWKEQEKAWDEKLKANPKGFLLEGRGRHCAVCWNGDGESSSWYDKWGIKCLTCQLAIDRGEIPAWVAKHKDGWYSKYDLESRFNLKGPALKKWIKDGIIKARTVTQNGKGVHAEIFLISDNKGFLPPKKLTESRGVTEVKNGETWHRSEEWYKFVDPHEHLKGYKIMDYMRVVPPEEMVAREAEKRKKWEEKQQKRANRPHVFRKRGKRKKADPEKAAGVSDL